MVRNHSDLSLQSSPPTHTKPSSAHEQSFFHVATFPRIKRMERSAFLEKAEIPKRAEAFGVAARKQLA